MPVRLGKPVGFAAGSLGGARLVVLELRGVAAAQFDQLGVCLRFLGEALRVAGECFFEIDALQLTALGGIFDVEAKRLAQRDRALGHQSLHVHAEGSLGGRTRFNEGGLEL